MGLHPLQNFSEAPEEAYNEVLLPMSRFAAAFLVAYLVGRLLVVPAVNGVVRRRNRNNPTIQEAIDLYLRLGVVVVAVIGGLAAAGYGRLLTGSALVIAAATLAIGVAGQEVLGALVSGLFLVANPDFSVGDWIAWNDREGAVEAIAFRTTRVRTPNNETITVPNTELTTSAIVRPYGREQIRLTEEVAIAYDDDVDTAMDLLRESAGDVTAILEEPEPRVYLSKLGDDAVVLQVSVWVSYPTRRDVLRVRSAFARAVKSQFEAAGLTISPATGRELSGDVDVGLAGEAVASGEPGDGAGR